MAGHSHNVLQELECDFRWRFFRTLRDTAPHNQENGKGEWQTVPSKSNVLSRKQKDLDGLVLIGNLDGLVLIGNLDGFILIGNSTTEIQK